MLSLQGGWEYNERSTTKMARNRKGMMYMSVVDAICELVVGGCLYGISLKDFMKKNSDIIQELKSGSEVPAINFLELYDQRIYDMDNKQDDIKIMKQLDFEGVYCIKNVIKKKYYIGCGSKVFRKVVRHFGGYGNGDIYEDYKENDQFFVSFRPYDEKEYDNINEFQKIITSDCTFVPQGYQCYNTKKNCQAVDIEQKEKKISQDENKDINMKRRKKRLKAFFFHRKKIELDVSSEYFIGKKYQDVINILENNGFNYVKSIALKDIYTNSIYKTEEVEKVLINKKSMCQQGEMISYDAPIDVIYHLKKEIIIPFSARQVKKRYYEEVVKEFYELGFTTINVYPIKDLRFGWLTKDGSVEKLTINDQEKFKKGQSFVYDVVLNIFYHTYK